MQNKNGRRGFTLIELLIVVAIIGILAAIAVPNFLLAQTRAKVARSKAELRNLLIPLESYATDFGEYPPPSFMYDADPYDYFSLNGWPLGCVPGRITTPVSYIKTYVFDVFKGRNHPAGRPFYSTQRRNELVGGPNYLAQVYSIAYGEEKSGLEYMILGVGPDQHLSTDGDAHPLTVMTAVGYDPSNGTVSEGDIHIFGPGNIHTVQW